MIKLREARITDGVPKIVAAQPWVQVLSEVYAELQGRVLDCLDAGVTFSEVDKCSEETLDQMAVYLKVEWYDSAADLETKRRIIKTAIEIQRYAGTVKAVREQVNATYPDSEVEEWFDYGGTPGFWRLNVNITDAPAQYHTIDEMEDLLGYTKRLTAHLERITYIEKPKKKATAYIAAAHCGTFISVTAKVRGKIKPQSGTVTAFAAVAPAGTRTETTIIVRRMEEKPDELE